jgi:hypothetical protein
MNLDSAEEYPQEGKAAADGTGIGDAHITLIVGDLSFYGK